MRYAVAFEGSLAADAGPSEETLEAVLDLLMDRLVAAGATDPAIGAGIAAGSVEVSLTIEAPDLADAIARGRTLIDAAFPVDAGLRIEWHSSDARRIERAGA